MQMTQMSRPDSDTVSLSSSVGRQFSKMEDVVELTVHGIEEVGMCKLLILGKVLLKVLLHIYLLSVLDKQI